MLSNPEYANAVRTFYRTQKKEKLSKPALESLAIVAYKQPVTRLDIELIRGVNSDGVVTHLLEKNLIKIAGRKDVPGKPFLYGTTKEFLEYFGLKSLSDMPKLEEFVSLEENSAEKIKAFQGVSDEFKEQAANASAVKEEVSPADAAVNSSQDLGAQTAAQAPAQEQIAQEQTPAAESVVFEQIQSVGSHGGEDEHTPAA
jgi:segregation and condensation protein B